MKSYLLSMTLAVAPAVASAQSLSFDLTARVSATTLVKVESAGGVSLQLEPVHIDKVKQSMSIGSAKRTVWIKIPAQPVKVSPESLFFGPRDPEKGWGLRLVRLDPKDGEASPEFSLGPFSMKPKEPFLPYPKGTSVPDAVKDSEGNYRVKLPGFLPPGLYAVVGLNGSTSPFSDRDGFAWVFEVPAKVATTPAPAEPAAVDTKQP